MSAFGLPNYYGVLEVDREADEATIKKAYRKLVLQWHPDKHQSDREAAEEKIRDVNDAYETLSNPFKRGQYDQQVQALERKARGYRLDTTAIKPRMSIPKEFMLSPMGHPEKFVRTTGMSLFIHARSDAKMEFYDFFRDTKFSLWWLPEVNNMCRLRPTTTAGVGQDGGLNFNFFLHHTVTVSEVVLSPNCMPECANVIAVASPVFQRAFRFESASFPGHYLAFKPPTHLRMVGGVVDETTAIDFVLVDYAQMFQYITTQEVLMPAITKLGGARHYIPLDTLRNEGDVKLYFQNVLKKQMWGDEDFETFFQSRSGEWDYDASRCQVRLRSPHEQLANSLRRSRNTAEVATAISGSANYDVCLLPIDTLEAMLKVLSQPPPADADVSLAVNILDAQNKILVALPKACEQDVSFRRLLSVYKEAANFGGAQADAKILKRRGETARELADIVSEQIRDSRRAAEHITLSVFTELCEMPLSWRVCSERLAKIADRLLDREKLDVLVPLIRSVVKALPNSLPLAEQLATFAKHELRHADPAIVAEALDALVSGGLCLDSIPGSLRRVLRSASFSLVATILAGLGERGMEGSDMRSCAAFVGEESSGLEALPSSTLLRLAVAATKSADVAENALDAVAAAASITLASWTMDDASKLLLAVAKPKAGSGGPGVTALYRRSCDALAQKLQECSSVQLIKVVLAIGPVQHCRALLEAAAKEVVRNRMADLESNHKLLFTQGVLPLGEKHEALLEVMEYWVKDLEQVARAETLLTESLGPELVRQRRKDLESKGQLSADQLAKLAQMLAAKVPTQVTFWEAFARRFVGEGEAEGIAEGLTPTGKAAMDATFPEGAGPDFEQKLKEMLLMEVKKPGSSREKQKKNKDKKRKKNKEGDGKKAKKSEAQDDDDDDDEDEDDEDEDDASSGSEPEPQKKKQKKEEAKKKPEEAKESSSSSSDSSSEDEDPEVRQKRIREKRLLNKQKKRAMESQNGTEIAGAREKKKKQEGAKKPLSKEEAAEKRRLQRERRLKMKIEKRRAKKEVEKAKQAEIAKKREAEQAKKQAEKAKKEAEKAKQVENSKKDAEKAKQTQKDAESALPVAEAPIAQKSSKAKTISNSNGKSTQDEENKDENVQQNAEGVEGENANTPDDSTAKKNAKEIPITYISAEEMKQREAQEAERRRIQRERRKAAKAQAGVIALDGEITLD